MGTLNQGFGRETTGGRQDQYYQPSEDISQAMHWHGMKRLRRERSCPVQADEMLMLLRIHRFAIYDSFFRPTVVNKRAKLGLQTGRNKNRRRSDRSQDSRIPSTGRRGWLPSQTKRKLRVRITSARLCTRRPCLNNLCTKFAPNNGRNRPPNPTKAGFISVSIPLLDTNNKSLVDTYHSFSYDSGLLRESVGSGIVSGIHATAPAAVDLLFSHRNSKKPTCNRMFYY
uniref:Uncharacterized protein n=1 Tax=Steinernema glaseri TaxID=37863 RepID=A0A1I8A159_9BILA